MLVSSRFRAVRMTALRVKTQRVIPGRHPSYVLEQAIRQRPPEPAGDEDHAGNQLPKIEKAVQKRLQPKKKHWLFQKPLTL